MTTTKELDAETAELANALKDVVSDYMAAHPKRSTAETIAIVGYALTAVMALLFVKGSGDRETLASVVEANRDLLAALVLRELSGASHLYGGTA